MWNLHICHLWKHVSKVLFYHKMCYVVQMCLFSTNIHSSLSYVPLNTCDDTFWFPQSCQQFVTAILEYEVRPLIDYSKAAVFLLKAFPRFHDTRYLARRFWVPPAEMQWCHLGMLSHQACRWVKDYSMPADLLTIDVLDQTTNTMT